MASGAVTTSVAHDQNVDAAVQAVAANKDAWRNRSVADKLADLITLRDRLDAESAAWATTSGRIRGIKPGGATPHMEAVGWLPGVAMLGSTVNALIRTYRQRAGGGPLLRRGAANAR